MMRINVFMGNPQRIKFQPFRGMRPFSLARCLHDAPAGVVLAAMSVPQALGYAAIAGMPSVTGLYTLCLPLLAFATLGASRYLVVAADSATAAILAGGISPLAAAGSARYIALAGMTALLTAGFLLLARLLKLGFLADFLSRTVLVGFLTGVGLQVGIAVLGPMLGLSLQAHRTVFQVAEIVRSLPRVSWPSMGLSTLVIGGVLLLDRLVPRIPAPLIAVVGSIAASAAWDFSGRGIGVIGPVAGGLPHLAWPMVGWHDIESLIPIAGSCVVMIIAQSAATARVYALRHHQELDENVDLAGLAAANAAAALSGAFVVNGSPTQTALAERSGGQSQFTQVSTALVVALTLAFLTGPIQYLPRCVLGSIVFLVAIRLCDFSGLANIRKESPVEYLLAIATAAVVVIVGVEQGIILAMVTSLLRIVHHSYRPHTAVLVQGSDGIWQLTPVVPGALTEPGLVIYRFGAALFYANAGMFSDEIRRLVVPGLQWVVVDAGPIAHVDYSAARVVQALQKDLAAAGVTLVFAHVESDLKPDLDRHHLTEAIGPNHIFDTLHGALAACKKVGQALSPAPTT
jgi:high affinity sulfate transporter 1